MKLIRLITFFSFALILTACQNESAQKPAAIKLETYTACGDIADDAQHYTEMCDCIQQNGLTFPTKTVSGGKLYPNAGNEDEGYIRGDAVEIDADFIAEFRAIVSDSSNFQWGEVGTTYTGYEIDFTDAAGKIINKASVTYEGMLGMDPKLGTTKWGSMTHEGDTKMRKLLARYIP